MSSAATFFEGLRSERRLLEEANLNLARLRAEAGLVWGARPFFDVTNVRANAALGSVVSRLRAVVAGHLVGLFAPGGRTATADGPTAPDVDHVPGEAAPLLPRHSAVVLPTGGEGRAEASEGVAPSRRDRWSTAGSTPPARASQATSV